MRLSKRTAPIDEKNFLNWQRFFIAAIFVRTRAR